MRLTARARSFFASGESRRKLAVDAFVTVRKGQPLAATGFIAESARNRPLEEEAVAKQVSRLGNTAFALRNLTADIEPGIMVPVSEINDARRRAVEALEQARLEAFKRPPLPVSGDCFLSERVSGSGDRQKPSLVVNVDSLATVMTALRQGADCVLFGGETYSHRPLTADDYRQAALAVREYGRQLILATPRIVKEWQIPALRQLLAVFAELKPDAIAVANPGTIELCRQITDLPLVADFPLNIFNSAAVAFFSDQGFAGLTLSPELTFLQIGNIRERTAANLECLVHGRVPLMISEHCIVGSRLGGRVCGECQSACRQRRHWLRDRKGERFPVVSDQFGRMHILNAKELSMLPHVAQLISLGVNRLRVEAKAEEPVRLGRIVGLYRRLIDSGTEPGGELLEQISALEHEHITRGHYFRGVLKE